MDDDVAADVGLALLPGADDAVVLGRVHLIAPDNGASSRAAVVAGDLNAVLVGLLDEVIDDPGAVVQDFDTDHVQHEFVAVDLQGQSKLLTLASTSKLVRMAAQWLNANLLPRMVGLVA